MKESVVTNTHAGQALCTRCASAAHCTIPGETDDPILFCDFFEKIEGAIVWSAEEVCDINQPDPGRLDGLCGDCENRKSCVFRRREGGTWHCEEYR
ncbi:MAG TPA: hypothetical protein PKI11_09425 [Candidatus Hydrogenedentes bacterium]|nr:hypothetical protein [Candidatus Hydrogenedentota bacterium]HNT86470.1 hypothetical protein [Candidatus Hydrogenedentota bacterium]